MGKKTGTEKLIVGIGSALMDILVREDDRFLESINAQKGSTTIVDNDFIEKALSQISDKPTIVPGGSACNTIIGVARLGGGGRFIGVRGKDEFGDLFETDLKKNLVEPLLPTCALPTGRVLSIISPDAQRSMFTHLGAASQMGPEDISLKYFENAGIALVEGYLLFNSPALMEKAMATAKTAGASVAIDLSSFTVVEAFKDHLDKLIANYVDILIANEDEARVFTGQTDEIKAVEALAEHAEIAVLKVGKKGSYISYENRIIKIEPQGSGSAIDTTGAGDLWAAGFLFGLINKYPLEKCGELGSACGWEVCRVIGADIPDAGWTRINNLL